ncbi:hypothetical protein NF27_DT00080 [Candidatus Jidaibacter acanthamoeba]|uniref:Histidine kinase domain-containing protein n=1 Tax=Candidatus Jidaibacter acanthamoebae TaxID=86105 RepID=A0A0C1QIA9_9RICK|nr:HAMP domain-containing histidine kinase [Candidatus Jidaibacter acanthamoeba]KIE05234.1 hypothetical protein NF27_DT00080 [Candidatus Jidaibacter acanthamoeba]
MNYKNFINILRWNYRLNYENSLFNKVYQLQLKPIYKSSILALCLICIVIILGTFYVEYYTIRKSVKLRAEQIHESLASTMLRYNESLLLAGKLLINNQNYKDESKVKQIFRRVNSLNPKLDIESITWHSKDLADNIGIYGAITTSSATNEFEEKFKYNSDKPIVTKLSKQDSNLKVMNLSIGLSDIKNNLIGYLDLPINLSNIITESTSHINLPFTFDIDTTNTPQNSRTNILIRHIPKIENLPYRVSIGYNKKYFLLSIFRLCLVRCMLTFVVGITLLVIYTLQQKKQIIKDYKDIFKQEIDSLKVSVNKLEKNNALIEAYKSSLNSTGCFNLELSKQKSLSIEIIRESNNTLAKLLNNELDIEVNYEKLKNVMQKIESITTQLLNNIVDNENYNTISLKALTDEIISLFSPIAIKQKITINNIIKGSVKIKANELILKQVLVSLLARAIRSLPEGSKIEISSRKEKQNIIFCFEDNGFGLTDNFLNSLQFKGQDEIEQLVGNLMIDYTHLPYVAQESLQGKLSTTHSHRQGNKVTLTMPSTQEEENIYSNSKIVFLHSNRSRQPL